MPQLEISTFSSQIFWLVTIFGILYMILSRYTLPTIYSIVQERKTFAEYELRKADKARNKAEIVEAEYLGELARARAEGATRIASAREEIGVYASELSNQFDIEYERIVKASSKGFSEVEKSARAEMQEVMLRSTGLIVEQMIGNRLGRSEMGRKSGSESRVSNN